MSDVKNNSIQLGMILLILILSYRYVYICIFPIAGYIYFFHFKMKEFQLNQTSKINLFYAFLFAFFMFFASQYVLIHKDYLLMPQSNSLLEILGITLGVAIAEEMFFRGYLVTLLQDKINQWSVMVFIVLIYGLYMRSVAGFLLGIGLTVISMFSKSIYPSIFASFVIRSFLWMQKANPSVFEKLTSFFKQSGEIQNIAVMLIALGFLSIALGFAKRCQFPEDSPNEEKEEYPVYKPTHHKRVYKRKFVR